MIRLKLWNRTGSTSLRAVRLEVIFLGYLAKYARNLNNLRRPVFVTVINFNATFWSRGVTRVVVEIEIRSFHQQIIFSLGPPKGSRNKSSFFSGMATKNGGLAINKKIILSSN